MLKMFKYVIATSHHKKSVNVSSATKPWNQTYKGYKIRLDTKNECYNIYDPEGELEDSGFKSILDAKKAIDLEDIEQAAADSVELSNFSDVSFDSDGDFVFTFNTVAADDEDRKGILSSILKKIGYIVEDVTEVGSVVCVQVR